MKRFKSLLFIVMIAFVLAGGQVAEGADYISVYTTGKITEYKAGKSVDLLDDEGNSHTYLITPDTEMPEKIKKGMIVEVSAADIVAVKIEVLSR